MQQKTWKLAIAAVGLGLVAAAPAHAQDAAAFPDVPRGHWASDAVNDLAKKGIFTGYVDNTFQGKRAMTRYEASLAIQRLFTEVQREQTGIFRVPASLLLPGPDGGSGRPGADGSPGPQGPPGTPPAEFGPLAERLQVLRSDLAALHQQFEGLGSDLHRERENVNGLFAGGPDSLAGLNARLRHRKR
jgi:hypothetical protein